MQVLHLKDELNLKRVGIVGCLRKYGWYLACDSQLAGDLI
jgi:hypothetical protein